MLNFLKYKFLSVIFVVLLLPYCGQVEKLSEIPEISYISHRLVDTTDALGNPSMRVDIEVYLIDGDGNIGLFPHDTVHPHDTSKIYIKEFRKVDNVFVEKINELPLHQDLPYLQPQGQNKALKCTIKVELNLYTEPDQIEENIVKYELFVVDRARNKSNVVSTPEIEIPK